MFELHPLEEGQFRVFSKSDRNLKQTAEARTDTAALFAGIVAIAISPLYEPGPYSIINLSISLALVTTIIGYTWENKRNYLQSGAVAMVLGLAAIPLVGTLADITLPPRADELSWVESGIAFVVWILVSGIVYILDRRRQPSDRREYNTP